MRDRRVRESGSCPIRAGGCRVPLLSRLLRPAHARREHAARRIGWQHLPDGDSRPLPRFGGAFSWANSFRLLIGLAWCFMNPCGKPAANHKGKTDATAPDFDRAPAGGPHLRRRAGIDLPGRQDGSMTCRVVEIDQTPRQVAAPMPPAGTSCPAGSRWDGKGCWMARK